VAHGQAGLQVGKVVTGQHGDGGGTGQADRLQDLRLGGVGDDHGQAEATDLPQPEVVVVLVHDHNLAPRGGHSLWPGPRPPGPPGCCSTGHAASTSADRIRTGKPQPEDLHKRVTIGVAYPNRTKMPHRALADGLSDGAGFAAWAMSTRAL